MFKNAQRTRSSKKGFTLIELLVVIGILSVLAVAALVTINPAEAQRKARDTQRLQDIATIQAIVEQYLNDNPGDFATDPSDNDSSGAIATVKDCGATGWLTVALGAESLCGYANVLPVDPTNRGGAKVAEFGSTDQIPGDLYYYLAIDAAGSYKICTRLESVANAAKLGGDGEDDTNPNANEVYAVFNADVACG